jgi:hypothetical protein
MLGRFVVVIVALGVVKLALEKCVVIVTLQMVKLNLVQSFLNHVNFLRLNFYWQASSKHSQTFGDNE